MGNGHRNMYYATGQPGWMRFGYSPGWGELPPGAKYLTETKQMAQFTDYLNQRAPQGTVPSGTQMSKDQEIKALESQADTLGQQLEEIKKRLKELGG